MRPSILAFAAALLCVLVWPSHPRASGQSATRTAQGFRIVVIEGEDAVNVIQQRTAVAPVVEVRDRNDQPVAGAVVSFAIRGGRATFNGARALTVTTNAAGRAVAAGLTPTGAGPLQISASAAFQGQTAAITIAQTNVATAAQAAAASAAGGGGAGTSGAAGGAGAGAAGGAASGAGAAVGGSTAATGAATAGAATTGGISATTLGIVGAAVAGGALAATKIVGASSDGTKYSGSYSGQFTSVVAQKNGTPSCTIGQTNTGTLTLNVVEQNGSVTGGAELQDVRTGLPGTCGGVPPSGPYFTGTIGTPLSGSLSNPTFNWTETSLVQPNNNTVTHTYSFVGSLSGGVITGTLSYSFRADDPTSIGTGSVQMPVTLR